MRWWQLSLPGLALALTLNFLFFYPPTIEGVSQSLPQTHLQASTNPIIKPDGSLAFSGYSIEPVGTFSDLELQKSWWYKKWDFYSVFHPNLTIAFALADLGYVGNAFIMVQERGSQAVTYEKLVLPFSEKIHLSQNFTFGSSSYSKGDWDFSFLNKDKLQKEISVKYGAILSANILYSRGEQQEGLSSYTPMNPAGDLFFYARKQYGYQLSGLISYKGKDYPLEGITGAMDWGRGVWPYRSYWVWATASTYLPDGRLFALNVGVHHAKHAAATDDFITLGDKVIKLGVVTCPEAIADSPASTNWTITTLNTQPTAQYAVLEATFATESHYDKEVNMWAIHSQLKQVFGEFSGKVTYEGGEVTFSHVRGFLERHLMRW